MSRFGTIETLYKVLKITLKITRETGQESYFEPVEVLLVDDVVVVAVVVVVVGFEVLEVSLLQNFFIVIDAAARQVKTVLKKNV